ncbi:MAG: pilus assembly protein [Xanthomonadaceae bacterium]|nr:pilus assembly protein [Xanthomonadaceae bacterium]
MSHEPVLQWPHAAGRDITAAAASGIPRAALHSARAHRQRGVALVVALILLVVITLVGLAAVRGTIMQQKMASNLFDQQIAFQSAEAAMRVAAAQVATNPGIVARNCAAGGVICLVNPFTDSKLPAGSIQTVTSGQFTTSTVAFSPPQFVVENMGNFADPSSSTGFNQSANAKQYQAPGASTTAIFYRITARSGDPAVVGDRAVVTLQAMIKQG